MTHGLDDPTGKGLESPERFVAAMASGAARNGVGFNQSSVATYADCTALAFVGDWLKRHTYDRNRFAAATA